MKLLFASVCLCLAAPMFASAELGQNELKVAETYGPAIGEEKISDSLVTRQYNFNGLLISVTFLNGTSQCETFKKADGAPLADEQIEKILAANANRLEWTAKTSAMPNAREWVIAGPKPSAPEKEDPMVFAVSGRRPSPAMGEGQPGDRQIAVDMLDTDDDSSSAPLSPPVLRSAVYKEGKTNSVLRIFTSAYKNPAKQLLREKRQAPAE